MTSATPKLDSSQQLSVSSMTPSAFGRQRVAGRRPGSGLLFERAEPGLDHGIVECAAVLADRCVHPAVGEFVDPNCGAVVRAAAERTTRSAVGRRACRALRKASRDSSITGVWLIGRLTIGRE